MGIAVHELLQGWAFRCAVGRLNEDLTNLHHQASSAALRALANILEI
jgi:hypothetical protein